MNTTTLYTTLDTARRLGISTERVRQLDHQLEPVRLSDGTRAYHPEVVERVRIEREARRAAKAGDGR